MSDTLKPRSNLEQILNGEEVTPKNRIAHFVKKAIDRISALAAGLPAVTKDDDGKVLGVVNGVWNKTEGSGDGANDFVVIFTAEVDGQGTVTGVSADKLVTEIIAAKAAGKTVIAKVDAGIYTQEFILTAYGPGITGAGLVGFTSAIPDAGAQETELYSVLGTAQIVGDTEHDNWSYYGN